MGVGGGRAEVLAAMEPVFTAQRVARLGLGAAAIVGTGVLWLIGALVIGADDEGEAILVIAAGMGACFWFAWQTAKKLVASVNIEWLEGPS